VEEELEISQSYISRLEKRIILKIKKDIEKQTMEK
jgi:DNA-directed RNA polymerase specialized sigma subunit